MNDQPILIAYDGSADARAAIDYAAELFPGARAIVLHVRQPLESVAAHLEGHVALEELRNLDTATLDASARVASEGAEYASDRGLAAEAEIASTVSAPSEAILSAARDLDARLVILGSRGRRGIAATLLGSTSTSVLHHATRPTLVVPSADVVRARNLAR
ncbi:universal stress protein [Nocardioides deserti]|uniref:Universal stress protein n=1 Tax=Nocardioides deserti TaxID=1588644 RepID=A0ABR6U4L2_9ACTN|nr:universal stress protein [Nocardioides deserti]MBC2959376.1 universal stress protein [Nocardioides deserti]GGO73315.1 universal stress protein [Nocardioides deserti]